MLAEQTVNLSRESCIHSLTIKLTLMKCKNIHRFEYLEATTQQRVMLEAGLEMIEQMLKQGAPNDICEAMVFFDSFCIIFERILGEQGRDVFGKYSAHLHELIAHVCSLLLARTLSSLN
jgi:hypothetical protein